jgi:hypothetical protein
LKVLVFFTDSGEGGMDEVIVGNKGNKTAGAVYNLDRVSGIE